MKRISVYLCGLLIVISCNNSNNNEQLFSSENNIDTLKHSFKFNGIFTGTTPCADCPGIYTVVEFSPDNDYFEYMKYLERDVLRTDSGTWKISDSVVSVSYKNGGADRFYRVLNDSMVSMLNANKQPVTAPMAGFYILKRTDTVLHK